MRSKNLSSADTTRLNIVPDVPEDMEQRQSLLIEVMRVLLMVLIVFGHMVTFTKSPISLDIAQINRYDFISEMFSRSLAYMIVPTFFVISGYFFFYRMDEWSMAFYGKQLRKRIKTLLLPYLLWNLLLIVAGIVIGYLMNGLGVKTVNPWETLQNQSLLELFLMPINFPLWFIRDLISMSLLTPLFYYLFRYTKYYFLIVLGIIYFTACVTPPRGFSLEAFFFFGVGSCFGLAKENLLSFSLRFKTIPYIITVLALLIGTYLNATPYYGYIIRFYIPFGVMALMNLTHSLIYYKTFTRKALQLTPAVFFLIGSHMIFIIPWLKGAFFRRFSYLPEWGTIVCYFMIPFIAIFICIVLFYITKKIAPKTLSVLVGGRIEPRKF